MEKRILEGTEVRSVNEERHTVVARALSYNLADTFGSVWSPGCFRESLANHKPTVCWGHDQKRPIGRVISHQDSPTALDLTIRMADVRAVPAAAEAWSLLNDGVIDGWSVGFTRAKTSKVPMQYRSAFGSFPAKETIHSAYLGEVSAVANASVPGTATLELRNQTWVEYERYQPEDDLEEIFARHLRLDSSSELDAALVFAKHGIR